MMIPEAMPTTSGALPDHSVSLIRLSVHVRFSTSPSFHVNVSSSVPDMSSEGSDREYFKSSYYFSQTCLEQKPEPFGFFLRRKVNQNQIAAIVIPFPVVQLAH